jgi:hypothetical protein
MNTIDKTVEQVARRRFGAKAAGASADATSDVPVDQLSQQAHIERAAKRLTKGSSAEIATAQGRQRRAARHVQPLAATKR